MPEPPTSELANRFWDFGNYITGCSVGQAILFSLSLGTSKELKAATILIKGPIVAGVVLGVLIYVSGVLMCLRWENQLRQAADQQPMMLSYARRACVLRVLTLLLANALLIGAVAISRP